MGPRRHRQSDRAPNPVPGIAAPHVRSVYVARRTVMARLHIHEPNVASSRRIHPKRQLPRTAHTRTAAVGCAVQNPPTPAVDPRQHRQTTTLETVRLRPDVKVALARRRQPRGWHHSHPKRTTRLRGGYHSRCIVTRLVLYSGAIGKRNPSPSIVNGVLKVSGGSRAPIVEPANGLLVPGDPRLTCTSTNIRPVRILKQHP